MSHGNCRGGGMEKVAAPLQSPRGPAGVNPAAASAGLSRGLGPRAGGWPRIQAAFCDAPRGCRPPSPAAITCWAAAASRPLRSAPLGSSAPPGSPQPRPRHRRRAAPLAAPAASRRAEDRGGRRLREGRSLGSLRKSGRVNPEGSRRRGLVNPCGAFSGESLCSPEISVAYLYFLSFSCFLVEK